MENYEATDSINGFVRTIGKNTISITNFHLHISQN